MWIHSDKITPIAIHRATASHGMSGVHAQVDAIARSRSHGTKYSVSLTGNSNHRPGFAKGYGDDYAATWDEWGMFIEALFQVDPAARIGIYPDHETFREVTFLRFDALTPLFSHKMHKWVSQGHGMEACKGCNAERNYSDLPR